jgi:hypothetical protein
MPRAAPPDRASPNLRAPLGQLHGAGLGVGVVLEHQHPLLLGGAAQHLLLLGQRLQGAHVVAHHPGHGQMGRRGQQIGHKRQLAAPVVEQRHHHLLGVAVGKQQLPQHGQLRRHALGRVDEAQVAAFLDGQDVFGQKGRLFAGVGPDGPVPVALVRPVRGTGEGQLQLAARGARHRTAAVVEVQVGQKYVGYVGGREAEPAQGAFQRGVAVQVEVPAEFLVLLVADAVVDEHQPPRVLDEQAAHGPGAHIVVIGRVLPGPE